MKTNQMAEPKQLIQTFLNPANQISYFQIQLPGTKQWILNLFIVLLATTASGINFQIVWKCCLLYFRFYISAVVSLLHWPFQLWTYSQINSSLRFFWFAPVVCAFFYLYTAFSCHYHEIHHAVLGKKDCIHCLSSCIIWSFLSGLSQYWRR